MEQQANGSLRLVMTGIAIATSLMLGASAIGQQSSASRAGSDEEKEAAAAAAATSIDAQTGKILNEAIELLNMEKYAGGEHEDQHAATRQAEPLRARQGRADHVQHRLLAGPL